MEVTKKRDRILGMVVPRGALLNFSTVLVGALVGLALGSGLSSQYKDIALSGLGLVVVGIGLKMFFGTKNVLIIAGAISIGGIVGSMIGFDAAIQGFAEFMRRQTGASDAAQFNQALIATSVLFCVGPMTLLGCMEDAIEGKLDLLSLKSAMDGVAAVFFAAASRSAGLGVLVTAFVVLVSQSLLTIGARKLQPIAADQDLLAELSAAGGIMLMGIGLGLLEIKRMPVADYLPALAFAPIFVLVGRRIRHARAT